MKTSLCSNLSKKFYFHSEKLVKQAAHLNKPLITFKDLFKDPMNSSMFFAPEKKTHESFTKAWILDDRASLDTYTQVSRDMTSIFWTNNRAINILKTHITFLKTLTQFQASKDLKWPLSDLKVSSNAQNFLEINLPEFLKSERLTLEKQVKELEETIKVLQKECDKIDSIYLRVPDPNFSKKV